MALGTALSLTILALLLSSVATARAIVLHRKADKQTRLLNEANASLADVQQKLSTLEEKGEKFDKFKDSLTLAEITTRLQKPRLSAHQPSPDQNPPERYQYVHSLAAGGMSSHEIASILSLSIHEANQLVTLARLAHPD